MSCRPQKLPKSTCSIPEEGESLQVTLALHGDILVSNDSHAHWLLSQNELYRFRPMMCSADTQG